MISGCRMTRLLISRCFSVFCKLLSIASCRHGFLGSLEKKLTMIFDFFDRLYASALCVKVMAECVDFVLSHSG